MKQSPWKFIKENIEHALKNIVKEGRVEEAKEGFGDFTFPCFFSNNPEEVSEYLAKKLKIKFVKIESAGPYVNFYIDWQRFGQRVLKNIDENYGKSKASGKTVVVEFSSPNPAHPFHMGTVRSTLIGESLSRILERRGFKVKRICYINDLGKQAATLILGYKNLSKKGKPDVLLGKIYFSINRKMNKDLEKRVFEILKKYEEDEEFRKNKKKIFELCVKGFKENWKRIGVKFDNIVWESSLVEKSKKVVEEIKNKKLCFECEGALILKLEPELPNTVLLRKDGTGLYLTRDIAFALWKEKLKPYLNIYVVAEDQTLHFKQLFRILELLGHKKLAENSYHVSYSMVVLEGEKMSARKGHMVLWDELLEEGIKKAEKEIEKRWHSISKREIKRRAEQIALSAITYFILKYSPEKTVNFSWENALRFEGDTGPYLLYTYARAKSILRKGKTIDKFDASLLTDSKEVALLRLLAKYPDVLEKCARDLRPHYLANFLHSLADAFNKFYESLPVLKAKRERETRLKLVNAVATVLKNGLALLGIKTIERM